MYKFILYKRILIQEEIIMFIKIRRDTLIILLLAFILILCGRLITYVAFASSDEINDGIAISGVIIKGNDIVPVDTIRSNVMQAGFRDGSVIYGDILKLPKGKFHFKMLFRRLKNLQHGQQCPVHLYNLLLQLMFKWIRIQV